MTRTLVTNVAALIITLSIGSASNASAQSQDDNAGRAQGAVRSPRSEVGATHSARAIADRARAALVRQPRRQAVVARPPRHHGQLQRRRGIRRRRRPHAARDWIGPSSIRIRPNRIDLDLSAGAQHPRLSAPGRARRRAQHRRRADQLRAELAGRPDAAGGFLRPRSDSDESRRVNYRLDTTDTTVGTRMEAVSTAVDRRRRRSAHARRRDREPTDAIRRSKRRSIPASAPGLSGLARVPARRRDASASTGATARRIRGAADTTGRPHRSTTREHDTLNDFRRVDVAAAADRPARQSLSTHRASRAGGADRRRRRRARADHLSAGAWRTCRHLRGFRNARFRDRQAVCGERRISVGGVVGARRGAVRRCGPGDAPASRSRRSDPLKPLTASASVSIATARSWPARSGLRPRGLRSASGVQIWLLRNSLLVVVAIVAR